MNERYDDLPVLGDFRESLRAAAAREMQASASTRRRGRVPRRGALAMAAAVLVLGGAAGAATLLSTGTPVHEVSGKAARYRPGTAGGAVVSVSTVDPTSPARWGVGIYRSRSGEECAVAGQIRGQQLGIVNDGRFDPYSSLTSGPCGHPRAGRLVGDVRYFAAANRTVVYGWSRGSSGRVSLALAGRRYRASTGQGGAFLFLFRGRVSVGAVRLTP